MIHELKTLQPFFSMVWNGEKTAEIRKDDRDFKVGGVLFLREWSLNTGYSGCYMKMPITSIVKAEDFPDALQPGYCLLSFGLILRGSDGNDLEVVSSADSPGRNTITRKKPLVYEPVRLDRYAYWPDSINPKESEAHNKGV